MNTTIRSGSTRVALRVLLLLATVLGFAVAPPAAHASTAATPFKVLGLYSGTYDAAHIDFEKEANVWFPQQAAANGFTYTSSTNWDLLANGGVNAYQVVLFLDDLPQTSAQRSGFETYMRNGGGFMGFHVSAFTTDAASWSWYHNTFLGSGNFVSNTWGPTAVTLKVEDHSIPPTAGLRPFTSSVSEWYSWSNDLRQNPDIKILASIDPSSFPVGTDPNQSWYSGYYPIIWTNTKYKMLYANFGHNAMNYTTNTRLSSTFASPTQNQFLLNGLKWLGGGGTSTPPTDTPISETSWYSVQNGGNGTCVDARSAATANGTAIQQYACNGTAAQQYQFRSTDSGYMEITARGNPAQVIDVTDRSTADNAPLQLWAYSGGTNQQWQPVKETSGRYHFVARHSGKCLTAPTAATNSVQLTQRTCDGSTAQSFQLAVQS